MEKSPPPELARWFCIKPFVLKGMGRFRCPGSPGTTPTTLAETARIVETPVKQVGLCHPVSCLVCPGPRPGQAQGLNRSHATSASDCDMCFNQCSLGGQFHFCTCFFLWLRIAKFASVVVEKGPSLITSFICILFDNHIDLPHNQLLKVC